MKSILVCLLIVANQAMAQSVEQESIQELPTPIVAQASEAPSTDSPHLETEATVGQEAAVGASTAVSATTKVPESEIPVNLEGGKKAGQSESPIFKLILSLSVLGVLGCAAYFFLKKYGQRSNKGTQATQIKVLSQHYLGPKKSLAIVRVAGESILIGITDHNVNLIKALSLLDEEIPEETPKSFQNVFSRKNQDEVDFAGDEDSKEEFSMSGIKDFVSSRLKNMRNIE